MTKERFIDILRNEGYSFEVVEDKIVVTDGSRGHIYLDIDRMPPNVDFVNEGFVSIPVLLEIPEGVSFNNSGYVSLPWVKRIASGTVINNGGYVTLRRLSNIPVDVQFKNRGEIYAAGIHIDSSDIQINPEVLGIKGISNRSLFNLMIRQGVFI